MSSDSSSQGKIAFGSLFDELISTPYQSGYNRLMVVSGFASGAFVKHLITEYENLKLGLVVGMARTVGIPGPDHKVYEMLAKANPDRFECFYYNGDRGVHAKAYTWFSYDQPILGFVGSANMSWSGLTYFQEAAVTADPDEVYKIFNIVKGESISVLSPDVRDHINIIPPSRYTAKRISAAHGTPSIVEVDELETVTLSLLTRLGEVHESSGLNWGQREGREPNQAYIPVQVAVHREHPGFFPPRRQRFTIQTDDGQTFVAVIAQQGNKAIETPENNSELGIYFRNRIGVQLGEFVEKDDLLNYGRTDVELTKIDDDLFLMNFEQ